MKKLMLLSAGAMMLFLSSCVSHKKFDALKHKKEDLQNQVYKLNSKLSQCKGEKSSMVNQIKTLKNTNSALLNSQGEFVTISKKAAENMEKSLESIHEKDKQLRTLHDAMNRKDSVTLALVTSLKSALGDLQDPDIQVKVEKGVVFVNIANKLLFDSGSFKVKGHAKEILAKVAKVVKAKPDIDFMVEGNTDTDAIHTKCMVDNWDLSTKRANAVVRILQNDYGVNPARMTSAGRSSYNPVASNDTAHGKALNRRTRIVILPKLDKFFGMIESGMKKAKENSK